jgi:hypothetical protein
MKRIAFVIGLAVLLVSVRMHGAPSPDALTMLRAALGGDAALGAVKSIRARGTIDRRVLRIPECRSSGACDAHFDLAVALPDRFVRTVHAVGGMGSGWSIDEARNPDSSSWPQRGEVPVGGVDRLTTVMGFDRGTPIPAPTWYEIKEHPEYVAPRLDNSQARLAEFLLPLMGATPASYPVVARSEAYSIIFSAVGGRECRLELDPVTHLPGRISWIYVLRPTPPGAGAVQFHSPRFGEDAPVWSQGRLPRPPVAPKPQTTWIELSDFRVVAGLRWPHRLITYRNGSFVEDMAVKRYEVNGEVSDKMFKK